MSLKITCNQCKCEVTHVCNQDIKKAAYQLATVTCEDGKTPIFSEKYLYEALGKEDARTLMTLVENVIRACGINPDSVLCATKPDDIEIIKK